MSDRKRYSTDKRKGGMYSRDSREGGMKNEVQEGWQDNFQMSEASHLPGCKATLYVPKC